MLIFLLVIIFIIYPLGRGILCLITNTSNFWADTLISIIMGLTLITLENYFVIVPNWAIYLQSFLAWGILFKRVKFSQPTINFAILLTLVLCTLIPSYLIFPFGRITPKGISLPGAHFIDSTWHEALIQSLLQTRPPSNYLYYPELVQNYHYFTDLQAAGMVSLTSISVSDMYFKYLGPLYQLLLAGSVYLVIVSVTKSRFGSFFATVFVCLSSNLYYLVHYFFPLAFNDPSLAWIDFFSTKSVNYPLTFSLAMLNVVLYLLPHLKKSFGSILIMSFFVGSITSFKLYTLIILLPALVMYAFFKLLSKNYYYFGLVIGSTIITSLLVLINFKLGSSSLIISPFWYIKVMFESEFHLHHSDWELKRQYLISVHAYLGVAKLYVEGLAIFLVINLGPFIMAPLSWILLLKHKYLRSSVVMFSVLAGTGLVLTMSFIYAHTAIVTIQFFYYTLVFCIYLFSIVLASLHHRHRLLATCIGVLVWVIMSPGVDFNVNYFLSRTNHTDYSNSLIQAVKFLSNQPPGLLLLQSDLRPGSFITAYSNHPVYLGDEVITSSLNLDINSRLQTTNNFFNCSNFGMANISYILTQGYTGCLDHSTAYHAVFSDSLVKIYSRR